MPSRFSVWTATAVICYAASTAIIAARLQQRYQRRLKATDYTTIAAFCASTFFTASVLFNGYTAFERPSEFSDSAHALANLLYALSLTLVVPLTKISIIYLFLELEPERTHRRLLQLLLALITTSVVAFFAVTLFGCQLSPDGHIWSILDRHRTPDAYHCIPQRNVIIANSATNVIYELAISLLAMPFVYGLRTGFSQKVGLVIAFALGFFTIGASLNFSFLSSKGYTLLLAGKSNPKYFYIGGLWGIAEVNSALIFANLLPLRGVLLKFMANQFARLGVTKSWSSSQIHAQSGSNQRDQIRWPTREVSMQDSKIRRDSIAVLEFFSPNLAPSSLKSMPEEDEKSVV